MSWNNSVAVASSEAPRASEIDTMTVSVPTIVLISFGKASTLVLDFMELSRRDDIPILASYAVLVKRGIIVSVTVADEG